VIGVKPDGAVAAVREQPAVAEMSQVFGSPADLDGMGMIPQ
jgi:hypothetical protein